MNNISLCIKKAFFSGILIAASCTETNAQLAQVSGMISSSLTTITSGIPTLEGFNTESQLENGLITAPIYFAVKTNRLWKLSLSITNIIGIPLSNAPAITEPLQPQNIAWGVIDGNNNAINAWVPFINATNTSTVPIEAKIGTRGAPAVPGNTFTLRFKVTPGFSVEPGNYSVDLIYTVTPQ